MAVAVVLLLAKLTFMSLSPRFSSYVSTDQHAAAAAGGDSTMSSSSALLDAIPEGDATDIDESTASGSQTSPRTQMSSSPTQQHETQTAAASTAESQQHASSGQTGLTLEQWMARWQVIAGLCTICVADHIVCSSYIC